MWRSQLIQKSLKCSQCVCARQQKRLQSTSSGRGPIGKLLFGTLAFGTLGTSSIVIYSNYDNKFRKMVEDSFPPLKPFLAFCLDHPPQATPQPPSKVVQKQTSTLVTPKKSTPTSTPKESKEIFSKIWAQAEVLYLDAKIAHDEALHSIEDFKIGLHSALEKVELEDEEKAWNVLINKIEKRNLALSAAENKANTLKEHLEKMRISVLSSGPLDLQRKEYQKKISNCLDDLEGLERKIQRVDHNKIIAEQFEGKLKKGRELYSKEVEVLTSGVDITEVKSLNQEQLDALIAFSVHKLDQCSKLLALQEVKEQARVEQALRIQGDKNAQLLKKELHHQLEQYQEEEGKKLNEHWEAEIRQELRRLTSAHLDHLHLALEEQQKELGMKYDITLNEQLNSQQTLFTEYLGSVLARLSRLEANIKLREELDLSNNKTQQLWLAALSLQNTLVNGKAGQVLDVSHELKTIEQLSNNEVFLSNILNSIPQQVIDNGVSSELEVKTRFSKVERICQQVALVKDNETGIWPYLMSYFYFLLVIKPEFRELPELEDSSIKVDPTLWNTYDVLARVRYCLGVGNYGQALRYSAQLQGKPKEIAHDWVRQLQLLYLTKQAADSILSFASALSIQTSQ